MSKNQQFDPFQQFNLFSANNNFYILIVTPFDPKSPHMFGLNGFCEFKEIEQCDYLGSSSFPTPQKGNTKLDYVVSTENIICSSVLSPSQLPFYFAGSEKFREKISYY